MANLFITADSFHPTTEAYRLCAYNVRATHIINLYIFLKKKNTASGLETLFIRAGDAIAR